MLSLLILLVTIKNTNNMIHTIKEGADFDIDINIMKMLATPYNKRVAIFCVDTAQFKTFHLEDEPTVPILFFNDTETISLKSLDDTKHLFKDNYPKEWDGITMKDNFLLANAIKLINTFVRPVLVKNEGTGWHLEEAKSTRDWLKLTPFVKERN